jgi:hypothetical protein
MKAKRGHRVFYLASRNNHTLPGSNLILYSIFIINLVTAYFISVVAPSQKNLSPFFQFDSMMMSKETLNRKTTFFNFNLDFFK